MYDFSKDYDELYELACKGNTIIGYTLVEMIDFTCQPEKHYERRDICEIEQSSSGEINFYSPNPWLDSSIKEKEKFKQKCSELNLEWIKP